MILLGLLSCACGDHESIPAPARVPDDIFGRLGEPLQTASDSQREAFERGREVQLHRFTPAEGLGPQFNVVSCGACHERPVPGGGGARYRNFILQGQALSDGSFTPTGTNGVQTQYSLGAEVRVPDAEDTNRRSLRNPIPFFGVGLIAELDEKEILKNADEDDADGDGISGRPNYDQGFVGRFGRKAQTVSIEGFIRGPLFNHLGITSDPLRDSLRAKLPVPSVSQERELAMQSVSDGALGRLRQAQAAAPAEPTLDDDGVDDPELSEQDLFDLISFSMLLAAPKPDELSNDAEEGRALFEGLHCTGCHVSTLRSPRGLLPLYSDLLLHDMGDDLADGIVMSEATGREFRTQPLWGVSAVGPYLHDGRADTLDEAIRWHGGEAEAARDAYLDLDADGRRLLLRFLESLGGRSQQSSGLLEPDAPMAEPGEFGGPVAALSGDDEQLFLRGREIFDRDISAEAGLGTSFNGDSCRACHFDPVLGGSGPRDVDVTRQGIFDDAGVFSEPAAGTMVHRESLQAHRPDPDPKANGFEHRQTPSLFGLGLVDEIPEETLLSLQDPDDDNGDGIRGIAHILPDGRVGRLGWKADVPSLAEFARDGLTNEIGITVPEQPGLSYGRGTDDDGVSDPETERSEIEALVFFISQLCPPPRHSTDEALEAKGENLFASTGCSSCHLPELETSDGEPVRAYSDFLLHQIMPEDYRGIVVGLADQRTFRTAPLWGIAETAPYMHDGRAFTLKDAILDHAGEGQASREAFEALSASDRKALLAFLQSL